ncbi:hypothetical protein DERP_000850 [Dermatophagoides pteronyssinus]|uniref:Uncharacterized protein n=2 Tax=Dermatophagoides pteronyssinus TaxID=6956 RepID=A0ABQ8J1A5_DERPT|nr:uncharacterized protein LOC113797300 [Dermatophagoides pteronyssinus]KAH9416345.1 hypothetical protein DERP_000850 [Dermatophagoides pteronyssinus]
MQPKAKNILPQFFLMIKIKMAKTDRIVKPHCFQLKKWSTIILNSINLIVLTFLVINLIMTSNYFGNLQQKQQQRQQIAMNSTKSIRQNNFAISPYIDYYDYRQQQQQHPQSNEDFNQFMTEFYTNITEIIIDLIGLVAVIKEHYYLSLIYIVLGTINLIGTIVMYTEMRTYSTLGQMIMTIVCYTVLLFYVKDLVKIQKQQKQIDEEQQQI